MARSGSQHKQWPGCLGNQALFCALAASLFLTGCWGRPDQGSIGLRKTLQERDATIATLQREVAAAKASLSATQSTQPAVETLPVERIDKLFTTHGVRLGRLTGGADLTYARTGVHDGLKVYVIPFDETGDELKAGGTITVEAFDLAADPTLIGKWHFDASAAKPLWNGQALLYEYVVPCQWQTPPAHSDLTVKVTFVDELTGRSFTAQTVVKVVLKS